LDEVPDKTQELINQAGHWLQEASREVDEIKCEGDFEDLTNTVDRVRISLMKVDSCLDDCVGILAGYQKALIDINAPQPPASDEHGHAPQQHGNMVMPDGFDPTQMFSQVADQLEELKDLRKNYGGNDDGETK
jgi:hypothetical protein